MHFTNEILLTTWLKRVLFLTWQYLITVLLLFKNSGMFWVTKHCIYYVKMYLVCRNDRHLLVNVKCFYKTLIIYKEPHNLWFWCDGFAVSCDLLFIFHHLILTYVWASTSLACVWALTQTHLVFVSVSSHFKFVSVLTHLALVLHQPNLISYLH